jgi:Protein of unknown function (DUF4054)
MSISPCASTPPVHGVVVFEPTVFVAEYPEFTGISNPALIKNFRHATLQLNNSCGSLVRDAAKREILLGLLTAHLTFLNNGTNDGAGNVTPPYGVVGRIASATEGSVSAGVEYDAPANASQAWLIQTKYGAEYWSATAKYRTMRYITPRRQSVAPGLWGPWGG